MSLAVGTRTEQNTRRRNSGDGGLTFIKSRGLWCIQIEMGKDENGKRIRKSFTGKTKSEAIKKKTTFVNSGGVVQALADLQKNSKQMAKHRLEDFLMDYLRDYKLTTVTNRTFAWYRDLSKHINKALGDIAIEDLKTVDIQRFLNMMSESSSNSKTTLKGLKSVLGQMLEHAIDEGIIASNPISRVKTPRTEEKKGNGALSDDTFRKVIGAIKKSPTYYPMITLLTHTGMRVGELLALRWENVDRERMLVYVEDSVVKKMEFDRETLKTISRTPVIGSTKTHCSQRAINILPETLEILDEWKDYYMSLNGGKPEKQYGGLIFTNKDGNIRSYDGFRQQFNRFLKDNNLDGLGITFHRFRHTYATILIEAGVNPRVVQELLGHRHVETTLALYTTVRAGVKEKEVAKLAPLLDGILTNHKHDIRATLELYKEARTQVN